VDKRNELANRRAQDSSVIIALKPNYVLTIRFIAYTVNALFDLFFVETILLTHLNTRSLLVRTIKINSTF